MKIKNLLLAGLGLCTLSSLAFANDFPVTFNTKFGPVTIEQEPHRVATLDYSGADDLLALGIQPVTVRYWYGDYPRAVWPWADKLLQGNPTIIQEVIDIEQVAKQKPDVILALWSGITEAEFKKLSAIAPVVAVPEGVSDYALPWDERAILAGKAVGKEELAKEKVADIKEEFAQIRAKHPNWKDKIYSIAYTWNGTIGSYAPDDIRPLTFNQFGLTFNPQVAKMIKPGAFYMEISPENIKLLDTDVLVWVKSRGDNLDDVKGRKFLKAYKEGREVILDFVQASAFSHSSLLSLPYVIETLTPQVEEAMKNVK